MGNVPLRSQLISKLWAHFTPKEMFGLTSPDKLQKGDDLAVARRTEMAQLLDLERQLHELRREDAVLNASGKIIRAAEFHRLNSVKRSEIIENTDTKADLNEINLDLPKLLNNAEQLGRYEVLERLLRLQKIYLHAERLIGALPIKPFQNTPINRRWLDHWKLKACEVTNGALQQLWVLLLLKELQHPGSNSLRVLDQLSLFNLEDANNLGRLGAWSVGGFIPLEVLANAHPQHYKHWLKTFEDQGLVRTSVTFSLLELLPQGDAQTGLIVPVGGAHFSIQASQEDLQKKMPGCRLTGVGIELIGLIRPADDQDYKEKLAKMLRKMGVSVQIIDETSVPTVICDP